MMIIIIIIIMKTTKKDHLLKSFPQTELDNGRTSYHSTRYMQVSYSNYVEK